MIIVVLPRILEQASSLYVQVCLVRCVPRTVRLTSSIAQIVIVIVEYINVSPCGGMWSTIVMLSISVLFREIVLMSACEYIFCPPPSLPPFRSGGQLQGRDRTVLPHGLHHPSVPRRVPPPHTRDLPGSMSRATGSAVDGGKGR